MPNKIPILSKLSGDDFPWYVAADISDVVELLMNPYEFVEKLNANLVDLTGDPAAGKIELAPSYTIRARLHPGALGGGAGQKDFLIHGINKTGAIIIRAKDIEAVENAWTNLVSQTQPPLAPTFIPPITADMLEDWEALWIEWSTRGAFDVSMVPEFKQGYGHREIAPAGITSLKRANRMAAFLIWGSMKLEATTGKPTINRLITRADAQSETIDVGALISVPGTVRAQKFRPLTAEALKSVTFTVMGLQSDHPAGGGIPNPPLPGCFDGSGRIVNNLIDLDDVTLKDYRQPTVP